MQAADAAALRAFGQALNDLRSKRDLTQVQVSQRSGISQPALSRIENGLTDPTLTQLARLAHALDLAASDLLHATTRSTT